MKRNVINSSLKVIIYIFSLIVTLLYLDFIIGFIGIRNLNSGHTADFLPSLLLNVLLMLLFGLQHTLMSRKFYKHWLHRNFPNANQRSIYLLATSIVLVLLMQAWKPIPLVIFDLRGTLSGAITIVLFAIGCFLIVASTFQLDHLRFFGLRQEPPGGPGTLKKPLLYRLVRHPIYLGWLLIHWATPYFTIGQLVLAIGMTIYIRIALFFEVRDLLEEFGEDYKVYMQETPSINPFLKLIISARRYKLIRTGINLALILMFLGLLTNQFLWIRRELQMMESDNPGVWKEAVENLSGSSSTDEVSESILFVGSSSFRFWDTMQEDLRPFRVTNFGFGGSKINDIIHYREQLIYKYQPSTVVLFAGTNDLAGKPNDKDALTVFRRMRFLIGDFRQELPGAHLYILPITPTPGRWDVWPEIQKANEMIKAFADEEPLVHYVDCTNDFLNASGKPDMHYFMWDGIHMNKAGYSIWIKQLKESFHKHSLTALHGEYIEPFGKY